MIKIWQQIGTMNGDRDKIIWNAAPVHQLDGSRNDIVQLQNGLLLNVRQADYDNVLLYSLGEWDDETNQVVWWD
ncbi:hypothetical protein [Jeotgalibacillus marinus]|uniref:Uncharacterized protein n=1 Tax=Jeotgalibacillus marinus TaxID=86667 RepID=A0ABV3Q8I5_9BACL